jgi:menaquinol-cytochrome c reductase iron-sulfur subunit
MLRRKFLSFIGKFVVVSAAVGGGIYSLARALVPSLLYEPSARVDLGDPAAYPEGVTFISDRRMFVVREGNKFHAISAVCTHLGCTVHNVPLVQKKDIKEDGKILQESWEFACPCHGSKYYGDGVNYAGPAPKPLPNWFMYISSLTGHLVVDMSKQVNRDFRVTV